LNAQLHLRFNKPLNKLTVNTGNIALERSPFNIVVDSAVSLQDSGRTVVITPTVVLSTDASYFLSFAVVSDLSGNTVDTNSSYPDYDVGFSTSSGVPTAPPMLLAFDPPDGSQYVPPNTNV
jgi:hypothetical protein